MRRIYIAAAAAIVTALAAAPASAGYTEYTLCWTASYGGSECVALPRNYSIRGIGRPRIPDESVSFRLTRGIIKSLGRIVSSRDMSPGQEATIYAPRS